MSLLSFEHAFFEGLFFSGTDDDGEALNKNFSPSDLSSAASLKLERFCTAFYRKHQPDWGGHISDDEAGHCFSLSVNGHGTGFFDNDELPKATRDALQKASRAVGEVNLYVGDDGQIYL